ncbi:ADP-ribosylase [Escherichia phage vB_EcoM-E33]|nr:ADP-ribosylase [Escherichia phage vB_EcoM-E33]
MNIEQKCLYQDRINSKFSKHEQNLLEKCLDAKKDPNFHYDLDKLVRKHVTSAVPVELYRGITTRELEQLELLSVGCQWSPGRVTSFSTQYSQARQFAGAWEYGTKTILSLRNAPFIFDYYNHAIDLVLAGNVDALEIDETRIDLYDMVETECEFMVSSQSRFEIVAIETVKRDPYDIEYKTIHLKMLDF